MPLERMAPRAARPVEPLAPPARYAPPAAPRTAAAPPARRGDWEACNADDSDRRISGCTRIIADTAESVRNRTVAYLQRGMAHARKGELDRAIADFDEVVRVDPSNAAAYFNRSLAYRAKGDPARADADRAQAIGIDARYGRPDAPGGLW
jgi:tetratricopeptide (TPR) repeat protein